MPDDWLAEQFDARRGQLRAVAPRILGTPDDADDAVQEAWLRIAGADRTAVTNLGGWRRGAGVARDAHGTTRSPHRGGGAVSGPVCAVCGRRPGGPGGACRRWARHSWWCSTRCRRPSALPSCCTTCSPFRSTRLRPSLADRLQRPGCSRAVPAGRSTATPPGRRRARLSSGTSCVHFWPPREPGISTPSWAYRVRRSSWLPTLRPSGRMPRPRSGEPTASRRCSRSGHLPHNRQTSRAEPHRLGGGRTANGRLGVHVPGRAGSSTWRCSPTPSPRSHHRGCARGPGARAVSAGRRQLIPDHARPGGGAFGAVCRAPTPWAIAHLATPCAVGVAGAAVASASRNRHGTAVGPSQVRRLGHLPPGERASRRRTRARPAVASGRRP